MKNRSGKRIGLVSLLLAALGITSGCDLFGWGMCMYGSPTADFDVEGKVTDEEDKPIEGIQVVISQKFDDNENVIYDYNLVPMDTLHTDRDGKYTMHRGGAFGLVDQVLVDIEDVDGEANGGEFDRASLVVGVEYKDSDGSWYMGKADIKVPTVRLKKK